MDGKDLKEALEATTDKGATRGGYEQLIRQKLALKDDVDLSSIDEDTLKALAGTDESAVDSSAAEEKGEETSEDPDDALGNALGLEDKEDIEALGDMSDEDKDKIVAAIGSGEIQESIAWTVQCYNAMGASNTDLAIILKEHYGLKKDEVKEILRERNAVAGSETRLQEKFLDRVLEAAKKLNFESIHQVFEDDEPAATHISNSSTVQSDFVPAQPSLAKTPAKLAEARKIFRKASPSVISLVTDDIKRQIKDYNDCERVSVYRIDETPTSQNIKVHLSYNADNDLFTEVAAILKKLGAKYIQTKKLERNIICRLDLTSYEKTAAEIARQNNDEFETAVNALDIDKYKPSQAILDKLKAYRDKGSKVNAKAIKDVNKLLTYYYGAVLLDWKDLAQAIQQTDLAWDYQDELTAIRARVNAEASQADTRDAFAVKYNLPSAANGLFTFEQEGQSCWLPKKILMYFVDRQIPVYFGKRTSGARYDHNGAQWSEIEHLTVYPGTPQEKQINIVVHTNEGNDTRSYTVLGATSERVSADIVLNALKQRFGESQIVRNKQILKESEVPVTSPALEEELEKAGQNFFKTKLELHVNPGNKALYAYGDLGWRTFNPEVRGKTQYSVSAYVNGGKLDAYHVHALHAYDDADYFWAYSYNLKDWYFKQNNTTERFHVQCATIDDVLKELDRRNSKVEPRMMYDSQKPGSKGPKIKESALTDTIEDAIGHVKDAEKHNNDFDEYAVDQDLKGAEAKLWKARMMAR